MIYITGDCHGDWTRFSSESFPEQKEMTRDDFVIVCGDFGLWEDDKTERWWFKWLAEKNFTLLFVDGNHENFDRLYGDEFEIVDFHGGKAHKLRENIYHLMRGHVFSLCGKKFFAFGGASSHDIKNGILDPKNYSSKQKLIKDYHTRTSRGEMLRINHISWWEQELPTEEEMAFGLATLAENGNEVDYIVSHCCPQQVAAAIGYFASDRLTQYFDKISDTVKFSKWFFGHLHDDRQILRDYILLYEQIIRIV